MASAPVHDRPDGIAVVTIDLRNATSSDALAALRSGLDIVASRLADGDGPGPRGVVLWLRGGGDVPVVDPASIIADAPEDELTAAAQALAGQLSRIEDTRAPTVAILEGRLLGAGFEAALACRHRIMLDVSDARIGLPALSVGLLPAAGGIGRLLRRMPVRAAIDFLAKAGSVDAAKAEELGLVDQVAGSSESAEALAVSWLEKSTQRANSGEQPEWSVDPGAAQTAAASAMTALPGRRRAAIALAAVVSAWATEDKSAAAAMELRRAAELATHGDTRAWIARQRGSATTDVRTVQQAHGPHVQSASHDANEATARVRAAGLLEAMALVGDGVPADRVEKLAESIGLRPTPLAMLDEVSLAPIDAAHHASGHSHHGHGHHHDDHAHHAHHHHHHDHDNDNDHDHGHGHGHGHDHGHEHSHAHEHDGNHHHDHGHGHDREPAPYGLDEAAWPEVPPPAVHVLEKMAHGFGRQGRSGKGGFYDYPDGSDPVLWSGLQAFERPSVAIDDADVTDRLVLAQAMEALRSLAQGHVTRERLDEFVRAAGFPLAGGITALIGRRGRAAFEARCAELASRYGKRFALPDRALDMFSTET